VDEGVDLAADAVESPMTTSIGSSPTDLALHANSRLKEFPTVMTAAVRSRQVNQSLISVATASILTNLDLDASPWTCRSVKQSAMEFHDCTAQAEYVAWSIFIDAVQRSSVSRPILLVVEGGVETIAAINARTQPILKDLLPDGVTLIRGRAATEPTDFVADRALGDCVKDAEHILDQISQHPEFPAQVGNASTYYSRVRVWPRNSSTEGSG
jgi:hypothetical protein